MPANGRWDLIRRLKVNSIPKNPYTGVHPMYISAFNSIPISLLANTKASVLFLVICMLLPYILTSLA